MKPDTVADRRRSVQLAASALVAALALVACGAGPDAPVQAAADAEDADAFGICRMLSADQVATVLPGHDGGYVAHSGGSLLDGVDAYQCSYTATSGSDFNLFTLIVNVASTDALFAEIRPSGFARTDEQKVDVGDGGWISDEMDDNLKITFVRNRARVDLELLAPGARDKSSQMLELARVVAGKV